MVAIRLPSIDSQIIVAITLLVSLRFFNIDICDPVYGAIHIKNINHSTNKKLAL